MSDAGRLTLGEALQLPAFRQAAPRVLAGAAGVHRELRWVHASERSDVHDLLRAGDLLLSMGTGLPADDDRSGFEAFATSLAHLDCAGLVIELGQRWTDDLPPALLESFDFVGVPLVALGRQTRFAALSQAIGERVIDAQVAELRDAQRVHQTFTDLSFAQAGPTEILEAVQRLVGGPVVLENAAHRPLDYLAGGEDPAGFLDRWQVRSARVRVSARTGWDSSNGWLVTRLGTAEQDWGRLVIASPSPPTARLTAVAERAAAALALHRLHSRDRATLVRRTHRDIMNGLRTQPDSLDIRQRADVAGFPTQHRRFLALVIRRRAPAAQPERLADLAASAVRAAHAMRTPALVCDVEDEIRVLLALPSAAEVDAVADRFATRLHARHDVLIAAARPAPDRAGIATALSEAGQVAAAIPDDAGGPGPGVHRLADLHLRGLLALFGADERLRLFVDRELEPLRRHDDQRDPGTALLAALRALLQHPESKTAAAASLHLSRAAFYDRLAKIEHLLGARLDDPDVRVSLHVALIADDLTG